MDRLTQSGLATLSMGRTTLCIFAGLLVAQIIGTLQVYLSNNALFSCAYLDR